MRGRLWVNNSYSDWISDVLLLSDAGFCQAYIAKATVLAAILICYLRSCLSILKDLINYHITRTTRRQHIMYKSFAISSICSVNQCYFHSEFKPYWKRSNQSGLRMIPSIKLRNCTKNRSSNYKKRPVYPSLHSNLYTIIPAINIP